MGALKKRRATSFPDKERRSEQWKSQRAEKRSERLTGEEDGARLNLRKRDNSFWCESCEEKEAGGGRKNHGAKTGGQRMRGELSLLRQS